MSSAAAWSCTRPVDPAAYGIRDVGPSSQWLSRQEEQGPDAWKTQPRTGRPAKLTEEQMEMIPSMLAHGAEARGFRGHVWTCTRVAALLRWQFGVHYNPHYVASLLEQLQWSAQLPQKARHSTR